MHPRQQWQCHLTSTFYNCESIIDESKASSATARSAIEENYWRLECLALTLEKDRQDTHKQLQAVGRECSEASSLLS